MFDISLIIPTYNRANLLQMTLQSIADQETSGITYETIIIDDGSSDNTKSLVDSYRNRIKHLEYIYNNHDGFRVAFIRNIGINGSKGNVLVFVDSGMILNKKFIRTHYNLHKSDNLVVIGNIYGFTAKLNDERLIKCINILDLEYTFKEVSNIIEYHDPRIKCIEYFNGNLDSMRAPYSFFWTGNVSVKRVNIIKIGSFDQNFQSWGVEDIELGYRLYFNGLNFVFSIDASAIHYPHPIEGKIKNSLNGERDMDNKLYFYNKYKNIDTELYLSGCEDLLYNIDLHKLFTGSRQRFNFDKLNIKSVIDQSFSVEPIIIYGAYNGAMQINKELSVLLEFDQQYYNCIDQIYSVYLSLGSKTNFSDKEFHTCIISDFWIYLNKGMLYNVLEEAMRVSCNVLVLYEILRRKSALLQINEVTKNNIEVSLKSKNIEFSTYKYSEGDIDFFYYKLLHYNVPPDSGQLKIE